MNITFSGNLTYQAPGGSQVSQSLSVNQATYSAQQGGSVDIPSGSASGLAFPLSFGSVATPLGIMIKATLGAATVAFNGATAAGNALPVATGASWTYVAPKAGLGTLTSAVVVSLPSLGPAQIDYVVFGD